MKKNYLLFILFFAFVSISWGQNGDFESWTGGNPDYWTTIDAGINVSEETTIVHGGSSAASIEVTTGTQSNTDFRQDFDVVNGNTYDFSVWLYHTEGNLKARFYIGDYRNYSDNSITGSWQELTYSYTATATETIEIGLRFYDQAGFDGAEIVYVDDFTPTDAPLPVTLTSFTAVAVNGGVALNWTTATEVNNYGFEVEKEVNGSWVNIAFVEGHGNSNAQNEYSYFDNSANGSESYRLKQVDFDGGFEYSDVATVESKGVNKLDQNHPNPFNPSTQISFSIAEASQVNISIYNALGQKVAELVNQNMNAGNHSVNFNGADLASGFYFYRLKTPNYSKTMKMMLIK